MKKNVKRLVSVLCLVVALLSLSCTAFADIGINNTIISPGSTGFQTPSRSSSLSGRNLIMETGDGERITLPSVSEYFSEPRIMYVNAPSKNSIFAYQLPKADKNKLMNYPYHGIRVFAVAERGEFTCIVYFDNMNNDHAAWVESCYLTSRYPGVERSIDYPCVSYAYNIGDAMVSWSRENFTGSGQPYTVLKDTVYSCVQFTLDYQVISRGVAPRAELLYGPRTVYVNDGSGWSAVGDFAFDKIDSVHVVVNLPGPMDIKAVATVASCDMPDTFLFRQSVLDVMIQ